MAIKSKASSSAATTLAAESAGDSMNLDKRENVEAISSTEMSKSETRCSE